MKPNIGANLYINVLGNALFVKRFSSNKKWIQNVEGTGENQITHCPRLEVYCIFIKKTTRIVYLGVSLGQFCFYQSQSHKEQYAAI
jgi:hypothetical protein